MDKKLQAYIDSLSSDIARLEKKLEQGKQVEKSLRAREQRYRSIFNFASVGLAQLDSNGHFLEVNEAFCKLLGYARKDLLGRHYLELAPPDEPDANLELCHRLLTGELSQLTREGRLLRRDGAIIWARLTIAAHDEDDNGNRTLSVALENVSERKALQASLERIAAGLSKAEETGLSGTWKWDFQTGRVTASDSVLQLFGMHDVRPPLTLEHFLERIHPEDQPVVRQTLQSAVEGKTPYPLEFRLALPDGTERLVSASGEFFERKTRERQQLLVGVVMDVTPRRRAETALKESEERFRELFDCAVDAIFIADRDGGFTDVNRKACHLMGYRREELIGMAIRDLVPESEQVRLEQARKFFLEDVEHVQTAEWTLRHKNGTFLPVEISSRILSDGRWMAIARDIREHKQTREALQRYASEVQDLYDNAPCGYHSVDRDALVIRMNRTELDWLGYAHDEVVGKRRIFELMTPDSRHRYCQGFPDFMKTGRLREAEVDLVRRDGSVMPVLLSATAIYDDKGKFLKSRSTLFDMTELADAHKKLRQAATVFEHSNDAIIVTDANGIIVAVNKAFTEITGYLPDEVIGKRPSVLKSGRQDDAFYRQLWASLNESGGWQGEIWDRRKSGELFPAWQNITTVRDDNGNITEYISVFSDITTIKDTESKLVELAYHDPLTGLPNRLLFNDRMAQAIAHAKRSEGRTALLLLDLDRFKLINDTLGHSAGDKLLQEIGCRLKESIREEDTVARLGGDEFAIILAGLNDTEDAALLADKIGKVISRPVYVDGQALTVSTSIGIGIYPDDAQDPEHLSKCADIAMYGAKDKGRNAYEFYSTDMSRTASELLTIDRGLRNAVHNNELVLLYQPQIDLASGRVLGIEALIRWRNPQRGLQSPVEFIHVAEETNLIESIGDWVFDTACSQVRKWNQAGFPPVRIAINLSVRQIRRTGFVDDLRQRLQACMPLNGFGVDLEITETALQTSPDVVEALKEVKELGLKIAIDDFGTGYSSLNSLKHLPIDILKIDRSFIHGIPADGDDKAITSAIIAMAHSMGMSVIAEGIETQDQLRFVMEHQCDEAQGYLFSPPLSADDCERFIVGNEAGTLFATLCGQGRRALATHGQPSAN